MSVGDTEFVSALSSLLSDIEVTVNGASKAYVEAPTNILEEKMVVRRGSGHGFSRMKMSVIGSAIRTYS
jgi:hypothetical protein